MELVSNTGIGKAEAEEMAAKMREHFGCKVKVAHMSDIEGYESTPKDVDFYFLRVAPKHIARAKDFKVAWEAGRFFSRYWRAA